MVPSRPFPLRSWFPGFRASGTTKVHEISSLSCSRVFNYPAIPDNVRLISRPSLFARRPFSSSFFIAFMLSDFPSPILSCYSLSYKISNFRIVFLLSIIMLLIIYVFLIKIFKQNFSENITQCCNFIQLTNYLFTNLCLLARTFLENYLSL